MADCWICKQKAEYQLEKLSRARDDARECSKELGLTMAIIKEGSIYKVVKSTETNGRTVIEYINGEN